MKVLLAGLQFYGLYSLIVNCLAFKQETGGSFLMAVFIVLGISCAVSTVILLLVGAL